jgi:hypothetical protein
MPTKAISFLSPPIQNICPTCDEQVTVVNVDRICLFSTGQQRPRNLCLIDEVLATALMVDVHRRCGGARPCKVMKSSERCSEIWKMNML